MELVSKSAAQTKKIAADMALDVVSGKTGRAARIVALEGELGAGKTTFVQGFARGLGVAHAVRSPTFVLMKRYPLSVGRKIRNKKTIKTLNFKSLTFNFLYHLDCYRITDWRDLEPLGIKEIFARQDAIILIEWPERIRKILPRKRIVVHLDHIDEQVRKISIVMRGK